MYDILRRDSAHQIENKLSLNDHTVADWGMFCSVTMPKFFEGSTEKISGPNKTVKIDESKIGWRKYNRGHHVQGQWVFGGVEQGPGGTFLVPILDRTADTLTAIIREWINPGTTVISNCWCAYCDLDSLGYMHHPVNHSLYFVDPYTGDHTNTTDPWYRLKVFLGPYNRAKDYRYHLAYYMFVARCKAQ